MRITLPITILVELRLLFLMITHVLLISKLFIIKPTIKTQLNLVIINSLQTLPLLTNFVKCNSFFKEKQFY